MKNLKSTIIFGLVMVFSLSMNAQSYLGAKTSLQYSTINIDGSGSSTIIDPSSIQTFTAGLVYHVEMGDNFFFRPEVIYTRKGFDAKLSTDLDLFGDFGFEVGIGTEAELDYVELPLNLGFSYDLGKAKIQVYAGPTIGYASKATLKPYVDAVLRINLPKQELNLSGDTYNRLELGGDLGINFAIPVRTGEILLDARWNKSFTNFLDDPILDINITHQSYAFGVGYMHKLGNKKMENI